MRLLIPLIAVVLVAGCTQQSTPITEISVPGHGEQIYQFSYDIRESVKIASDNESAIRNLIANSRELSIIFNSTVSGEEKAVFQIIVFNLAQKLPTYFSYEGRLLLMDVLYYGEDGYLYNKTKGQVGMPEHAKILITPSGAGETAVRLEGSTIILKGVSQTELRKTADKLALIAMGVDEAKIRQYAG